MEIRLNWYTKRRRAKRDADILKLDLRIEQLTETIDGIDYELWPDDHDAFREARATAAWKRSDLIMQNFREDTPGK